MKTDSGSITATNNFKQVEAHATSGDVQLEGTISSVKAHTVSGDVELKLNNVKTADFKVISGNLKGSIAGKTPDSIVADIDSGEFDLALPAGAYDTDVDNTVGSVENMLSRKSGDNPGKITVRVVSGDVTLFNLPR